MGYQAARLLAGLAAEAALTASIGVVAGAVMGYLTRRIFVAGGTYGIDGGRMVVALPIVYVTSLAVTAALAWRAAQMPPPDASRHAE